MAMLHSNFAMSCLCLIIGRSQRWAVSGDGLRSRCAGAVDYLRTSWTLD